MGAMNLDLLGLGKTGAATSAAAPSPAPAAAPAAAPDVRGSLGLLQIGLEGVKPQEGAGRTTIAVSPAAVAAIREQLAKRAGNTPQTGLRVGVKAGGCSGLSYIIQFEDHPRPQDAVIETDGVKVYCDPKSLRFLAGTTLDYKRSLMKTGFEFVNPNQKSACGCGESFSV